MPGHRARILVHLEWGKYINHVANKNIESGMYNENQRLIEEIKTFKGGNRRHARNSSMRSSISQQRGIVKKSFLSNPFNCCSDVAA